MDLAAATDPVADPALQRLLQEARPRRARRLDARELVTDAIAATSFFALALGLALAYPGPVDLPLAAVLVLTYAVASRIAFYVGAGYAIPTQVVFVPMLFLVAPAAVPLLVALGMLLGKLPSIARRSIHPERMVSSVADAWHTLGPALVFALAGVTTPDWSEWPVYAAALGAQLLVDLASSTARERFALGIAPPLQLRVLSWVYAVDLLLAPLGLLVAFATADAPYAIALVLPLHGLLAMLARERDARIAHALDLSQAYRGTALLLGDVLEEADEYTGNHSRSVVSLSLQVAEEMGLDATQRRNVEFAALLHDVGKIAIPMEILRKPGPLDPSEWRVMRTHTIEGHRMLRMIGGVLADVGRIVRATHERWDGTGYPDGLARDEIPIEAAIVACCDSFDAMTTDRVYRRAIGFDAAMRELRDHAGSQFHPAVVDTLLGIVERMTDTSSAPPLPLPPLRHDVPARSP